jgi:hypothetical protein
MTHDSRRSTLMVAIAVALLASACASSSSPTAARATPQTMPSAAQDLKAGTYAYHFQQLDVPGKPFPKVLITVPDGWSVASGVFVHSLVGTQREIAVSIAFRALITPRPTS